MAYRRERNTELPDVLIGSLPDNWTQELKRRYLVDTIQPAVFYADGLGDLNAPTGEPLATILTRAPHRDAARAFFLWLNEPEVRCDGCPSESDTVSRQYSRVASGAVNQLLRGLPLGDSADAEIAAFPLPLGRLILATMTNAQADPASAHVEVLRASANGRIATVSLRVTASTEAAFGTAHPFVVLRRQDDGDWKVLQVSLNLPAAETERLSQAFINTSPTAQAERSAGVVGVTLATPTDGDTRPPTPELSWDNHGGAGLQVVEWQRAASDGNQWSDARLYLVTDRASRLKTQVTAEFATSLTRYRWRVWSVGADGQTRISPWRTMNIVQ